MSHPRKRDESFPVVVTEVVRGGGGLVTVRLRTADGKLRQVVMPKSLATFDNVEWSTLAVATLLAIQGTAP